MLFSSLVILPSVTTGSLRTSRLSSTDAVVVFQSPGGNLRAGIEIGRAIHLKGFATLVPTLFSVRQRAHWRGLVAEFGT